jgi:PAS domain S-box-containing protein
MAIREILAGTRDELRTEYPCHGPHEQRWFELFVAPLDLGTRRGAVAMHVDVSRRTLAERTLRSSKARLSAILEGEPECVKLVSPAGLLCEINAAGLAMLEAEHASQVLGCSIASFVHEADRKAFEELHQQVRDGATGTLEYRIQGVRGTERWVQTHAVPLTLPDEEGPSVLSVTRDITEQRRAQSQLDALERQTSLILASIAEGITVLDAQGRIVFENPAASEMLGWPDGALRGRHGHEVFQHHHDGGNPYPWSDCPVGKTLSDGVTRRVDGEMFVRRDQSAFPVEYVCAPMFEAQDRIAGAVMTFKDVSERKQAEERLAEQAALLDKARDAILVRDLDGVIIYWNKGAETLYGWTREETLGRHARELQFAGHKDAFEHANREAMANGEWSGELEQIRKDGAPVLVEGRWTLVRSAEGTPRSILAINTDITERRRFEQQMLQVERLESIGTLAGGIAHDLNNILTPILFSIEMLRADEGDPERLHDLSIIETCAKRGIAMVRQVLSFGRGVQGKHEVMSLARLVRETEAVIVDAFPKNIAVRVSLPEEPCHASVDATQIGQVLMNLCVNARDAMPAGGSLTISAECVTLDEIYVQMNPQAKVGRHAVLRVRDTGHGMSRDVVARAFEPFFTTKPVGEGTGLGLATTHAIVKSHGGFITLDSELGKGTEVAVYVPAIAAKAGPSQPTFEAEGMPRGNGELILVIDDEEAIRTMVQRTLERFGYRVILAANGAEGVALYSRQGGEVSLVLTDMTMPVMNGPATIVALRCLNPQVQIIASSGLHADGRSGSAGEPAIAQFLAKPYTAHALLEALKVALRR